VKNRHGIDHHSDTYGHRIPVRRDSAGRTQPIRNISLAEKERRRDHVVRLWEMGATRIQIARALDIGLDTVGGDLRARHLEMRRRYVQQIPDPLPIDWLEPDEPKPPKPTKPPYQNSVTRAIWSTFLRDCRAQHHLNRLAHDAADAEEAGDFVWLAETAEIMQSIATEATRMHRVLTDKAARKRGQREEDPPSKLAAVVQIGDGGRHRKER
jgi:hypothetical protein